MLQDLDEAANQSTDPPSAPALIVAQRVKTGRRGRPKVTIDPTFLAQALQLRGPAHIAPIVRCSSRTVKRHALEHQLVQPGLPVFTSTTQEDGTVVRTRTSTAPVEDALSDAQLDTIIRAILEVIFPPYFYFLLVIFSELGI